MTKVFVRAGVLLAGLLLMIASLIYLSASPAMARSATTALEGSQALAPVSDEGDRRPRTRTPTPTRTATRTPTNTPTPFIFPTSTPTPTPPPSCGLFWRSVPNPRPATALYGLEVVAPKDVWAVGIEYSTNPAKMLIEHWNGTQWSIVPAPNVGQDVAYLFQVSAVSANDIWAIGTRNSRTLAIHWDGTSWSIVDTPNPGNHENYITDVKAVSAKDVWAVGYHRSSPTFNFQSMTIHWDGTSWSHLPSPNPGPFGSAFTSIDALSANDIWVVGNSYDSNSGPVHTLTMHWDGSTWTVVPSVRFHTLSSVSALSSNDVWAVGSTSHGFYTVTMHWDGSTWSVVPTPEVNGKPASLSDVVAISSNDAWAVGSYQSFETNGYVKLMLHWDGTQWNEVVSSEPGTDPNFLQAVAAASATDVWTTGYDYGGPIILRYSDPCASDG